MAYEKLRYHNILYIIASQIINIL